VEAAALLAVTRNQAAQARADVVEETVLEGEEFTTIVPENTTLKANFTGNPQIDYKFDPNLPRELNGLNLSDYPFYSLVPDNINFDCHGLTDGFYANVEHKCQVWMFFQLPKFKLEHTIDIKININILQKLWSLILIEISPRAN